MATSQRPPAQQQQMGGQSQLMCGGCRTMLLYPQGAHNVRCARCSHINPVNASTSSDMAQLSCSNPQCRVQLMYPRGAMQVQCSLCGTLNDAQHANQLGHVVCNGCQITLMYAYGAHSVKCAVCNCVTPVNNRTANQQGVGQHYQPVAQQQSGEDSLTRQESTKQEPLAIVVENPAGVDANGNTVQNVTLGLPGKDG